MINRRKQAVIGVALLSTLLFGAESCEEDKPTSQTQGQKDTEQAFKQQSDAVKYPVDDLVDSLERRNLRERLLRQNDPDKIGYVYFFPFGSGEPFGYWTIKGKVSSTQSQMTTETLLVDGGNESGVGDVPITAPGDDGSYGENERGVFFFTTEGTMVQVCEDCYFYSDQPVNVGSIPELNN